MTQEEQYALDLMNRVKGSMTMIAGAAYRYVANDGRLSAFEMLMLTGLIGGQLAPIIIEVISSMKNDQIDLQDVMSVLERMKFVIKE